MDGTKAGTRSVRQEQQRLRDVENGKMLQAVLNWFLADDKIFANCKFHGNVTWKPGQLVTQALCWCWQETGKVTAAFDYSLGVQEDLGGEQIARTYPAFMNALQRYRTVLGEPLDRRFGQLAKEVTGRFWRTGKWVLMGFDGSRTSTPRTVSNEQAFCAVNYGQGKTSKYRKKKTKGMRRRKNEKEKPAPPKPQVWITLLWHMSSQLAWRWRLGPSNSSERAHVIEMLEKEEMPENTLYCGDAGFVGYPLWSAILAAGGDFLIRVGGNVELLSDEVDFDHERGGIVWCWPKGMQRSDQPPLKLRLIRVKVNKTKMWMLTSVLDPQELTAKQIIKYYQMRWGIEVEFRGLKQTQHNDKLKSRTCGRALVELDWAIRGTAIAKLLALREQMRVRKKQVKQPKKTAYTPRELSLASTLQALRDCMRRAHKVPKPGHDLWEKLASAVIQRYNAKTTKQARYRPKNPDKKNLGDPTIRKPTPQEKERLHEPNQTAA